MKLLEIPKIIIVETFSTFFTFITMIGISYLIYNMLSVPDKFFIPVVISLLLSVAVNWIQIKWKINNTFSEDYSILKDLIPSKVISLRKVDDDEFNLIQKYNYGYLDKYVGSASTIGHTSLYIKGEDNACYVLHLNSRNRTEKCIMLEQVNNNEFDHKVSFDYIPPCSLSVFVLLAIRFKLEEQNSCMKFAELMVSNLKVYKTILEAEQLKNHLVGNLDIAGYTIENL